MLLGFDPMLSGFVAQAYEGMYIADSPSSYGAKPSAGTGDGGLHARACAGAGRSRSSSAGACASRTTMHAGTLKDDKLMNNDLKRHQIGGRLVTRHKI